MPNHVHFLIKTKTEEELFDFAKAKKTSNQPTLTLQGFQTLGGLIPSSSRIISLQLSHLFNSYTQAYNKLYLRKGSLFRPNFKRKQITSDAYLTRVIFYIHHNPLHHGFTRHIADWPHSSYHAVVSDKLTQIKRKEVQDWFGSKQALEKCHNQAIKDLEKLENQLT
jgi:putative transposase